MTYTTLGRTGLTVSVAGLGCGGFSRLGQGHGSSVAHSIDVVRAALDAGVNFIDTAEHYRGRSHIAPSSVSIASSTMSVALGRSIGRKPWVKLTPTVTGWGWIERSVRSKKPPP